MLFYPLVPPFAPAYPHTRLSPVWQVWSGTIVCPSIDRTEPYYEFRINVCGHLYVPPALQKSDPQFWKRYEKMPREINLCSANNPIERNAFFNFWERHHKEGPLVKKDAVLLPK